MKTRIILNPMANKGNCGKRWPQFRAELEKHLGPLADHHIAMTRERNHAIALAQEAVDAGYRRLVCVGGDGTFSEMMNGVISDDRPIAPDLVLAQLPGGTSNELSRSFGQLSLADAGKALATGKTREIDVFRAEAKGYAGDQVTRYGFVLAIVGAAATISWRAQRVPLLEAARAVQLRPDDGVHVADLQPAPLPHQNRRRGRTEPADVVVDALQFRRRGRRPYARAGRRSR